MSYKAFYAIERRIKNMGIDIDRKELIIQMTDGKTDSLRELSEAEYTDMIRRLNSHFGFDKNTDWQDSPENQMRRKVWTLFRYKMNYTEKQLDGWCRKYGKFEKPLNQHTHDELVALVTQAEKVYQSFVKGL